MKIKDIPTPEIAERIALPLCGVVLMFMTSCGGGSTASSDSTAETDTTMVVTAESDTLPRCYLTADGIGPVRIGMRVGTWPDREADLYTGVNNEPGYECETYQFYNDSAEYGYRYPFTVLDFGGGKVDVIMLNDVQCGVATPGGGFINLASSFADVLTLPGIKAEWENMEDAGAWYWTWEGLWFQPSFENLDENLVNKMNDGRTAPVAADFSDDVTIGYIGTGLPF